MKLFSRRRMFLSVCRGRDARPSVLAAVLIAVAALSACASLPPDLAASREVALERIDSPSARVGRVRVWAAGTALRISGTLARPFGERGPIPGHLHIEAIGNAGATLARVTTLYHRRNAKARKAQFSETLPVDPRKVRKIRVVHHGLSQESC